MAFNSLLLTVNMHFQQLKPTSEAVSWWHVGYANIFPRACDVIILTSQKSFLFQTLHTCIEYQNQTQHSLVNIQRQTHDQSGQNRFPFYYDSRACLNHCLKFIMAHFHLKLKLICVIIQKFSYPSFPMVIYTTVI